MLKWCKPQPYTQVFRNAVGVTSCSLGSIRTPGCLYWYLTIGGRVTTLRTSGLLPLYTLPKFSVVPYAPLALFPRLLRNRRIFVAAEKANAFQSKSHSLSLHPRSNGEEISPSCFTQLASFYSFKHCHKNKMIKILSYAVNKNYRD